MFHTQSNPTLQIFRWENLPFDDKLRWVDTFIIVAQHSRVQDQQRAVAAAKGDMKKLGQDLETTEQLCSSLQQSYQEYCPDVNRQKREVQQLQTRYENVANQLNERWDCN